MRSIPLAILAAGMSLTTAVLVGCSSPQADVPAEPVTLTVTTAGPAPDPITRQVFQTVTQTAVRTELKTRAVPTTVRTTIPKPVPTTVQETVPTPVPTTVTVTRTEQRPADPRRAAPANDGASSRSGDLRNGDYVVGEGIRTGRYRCTDANDATYWAAVGERGELISADVGDSLRVTNKMSVVRLGNCDGTWRRS